MRTTSTCQACRRPASEGLLAYRKAGGIVRHETFLQCDVCERYACADCLQVYNIFSGYDFLCHECAQLFGAPPTRSRGH